MADVLLVHVREDEALADSIGISLERSGLTVARGESVFDVGDEVPCVVVLWSDVSTRSSMVRDVAIRAQREGKLVTATLGGCETPLGFARPAPHDLSEWGGDPDDPTLDAVFFAADRLVCAAKLGGPAPRMRPAQPYAQRPAPAPRSEPRELPETPLPVQQIYERAPRAAAPAPAADSSGRDMPPNLAAETLAWKQVENSKNPQDFLDYLGHYGPKGIFSELASMKLDKLTHKSKPPPKGSFIQHKATPHVDKKAAQRPAPQPQRKPEPKRAPEPPRARAEARPEPRYEARPPEQRPQTRQERPEQHAEARSEQRLSEISQRTDIAPRGGRTRVATAARRRAPQTQSRYAIHEENRRGFPWGVLVVIAVMGAGGLALYQNLPKSTQEASSPPGFAEAMRAGPASDVLTQSAEDSAAPDATTLSEASAPVKRDLAKKPAQQQFAAAAPPRRDGVGGPIVSMTPRRDAGGGDATPAPVVVFKPVTPSAAPATPPAAPAPAVDSSPGAFDPTTPVATTRYVSPRWVKQPGAIALGSVYPQEALDNNIPGRATLDCAILLSGKLNCVVASESPAGMGFGVAALKASKSYLASPQAADGSMAYGARAKLTIAFK